MQSEFEELLSTFYGDAEDHLEAMAEAVDSLACDVHDDSAIAALFRAVHTLKGDSGVVGLPTLSQSLHSFETELDYMRSGQYHLSNELIDPMRHIVDEIAFLLESTKNGDEIEVDFEETVQILATHRVDGAKREVLKVPAAGYVIFGDENDELRDLDSIEIDQTDVLPDLEPVPGVQTTSQEETRAIELSDDADPHVLDGHDVSAAIQPDVEVSQEAPEVSVQSTEGLPTEFLPEKVTAEVEGDGKKAKSPAAKSSGKGSGNGGSIKVDRDRLDKLINVIGELIIDQSMVEQDVAQWQAETGNESLAMSRLTKTVRDLQELSLSLRMVPIGGVFQKMARTARDLGRKLEKDVAFETEGEDTELDKSIVDKIGDPLLHMVRNAVDHGIENSEDRVAYGKPAKGKIVLRAFHQGGNIFIEIQDDGKGLDRKALVDKAISRGLIEDGDNLSDQEVLNLIFASGFSTASAVTDVSGRGVGMDVVRRNVEALRGSVTISSEHGKGSTVTIRLPLTLAILDGLSIRVGHQVYIVPILSVVESFQPEPSDIKSIAGMSEVVTVRDEVLPLLRLSDLLNGQEPAGCLQDPHGQTGDESEEAEGNGSLVVIVEEQNEKYALLVDELLGKSQLVIKNLETNYQKVHGIAGATIMGNGRIAMIIDVVGLVSLQAQKAVVESPHFTVDENPLTAEGTSFAGVSKS